MQILAGLILLGVLITFHELGHFLFAKWLGVRVLVFSVGFGPKLWGFTRGETEYRLSAIPLGGYVRMFGESLAVPLTDEEKKMSFMHQAIWRKSLIAFAGPLFNFILPVILFFFLLVGVEQVFAPRIGTLAQNGVAEIAGLKPDDLITAVSGQKVTTFSEVADIIAAHPNQDLLLSIKRKSPAGGIENLDIKVKPEEKPSNNPLEPNQIVGRIGIMPAILLPIVAVSSRSPLAAAGLGSLDEIKKIDGRDIDSETALIFELAKLKPGALIEVARKEVHQEKPRTLEFKAPAHLAFNPASPQIHVIDKIEPEALTAQIKAEIERTKIILAKEHADWVRHFGIASANGLIVERVLDSLAANLDLMVMDRVVAVDGESIITPMQLTQAMINNPKTPHVLGWLKEDGSPVVAVFKVPETLLEQVNLDEDFLTKFGIKTAQVFKAGEVIERRVGVVEAFNRACLQTFDIAWMTGKSLWLMIKQEVPASQIGGPIMLFDVAQQAAKKGLAYYIFIMCLLSVNLGLLNLLPIPALDGGHLLMFGIEAVQRKPLTERTRAVATQIGIAILLAIMAFAIFNDLSRLFR